MTGTFPCRESSVVLQTIARIGTVRLHDAATTLAVAPHGLVAASAGGERIHLWAMSTGLWLGSLRGGGAKVAAMAFSPDGRTLASGHDDGRIRLWDAIADQVLLEFAGHNGSAAAIAWSPNGKTLASGGADGALRHWDAATGKVQSVCDGHAGNVTSVAFSPDGRWLASGGKDRTVRLWEAATGAPIHRHEAHGGTVRSVAFSPDGKSLASGSEDRTVRVWSMDPASERLRIDGHEKSVEVVAYSPDGAMLASGGDDKTVRLWNAATGAPIREIPSRQVTTVAFSADGKILIAASRDGTAALWDTATGEPALDNAGHQDRVRALAFSPDGSTLYTGGWDRSIRSWDAVTGKAGFQIWAHDAPVAAVAVSPNGRLIASGGWDGVLRTGLAWRGWHLISYCATEKTTDPVPKDVVSPVTSLAFSPDGETLAWGNRGGALLLLDNLSLRYMPFAEIWDTPVRRIEAHRKAVFSVSFAPDGKRLVSGGADKKISVRDVATEREILQIEGLKSEVNAVAFSPDGAWLASGDDNGEIRIWDAGTGASLRAMNCDAKHAISLSISPDGRIVAAGYGDGAVVLWDAATGAIRAHRYAPHGRVWAVAFSRDGRRLASAGEDSTALVWDVPSLLRPIPERRIPISPPIAGNSDKPVVEGAILTCIRWLARHQAADGSWSADGSAARCGAVIAGTCGGFGDPKYDVAVTSLSLLAILGAGYTHLTRDQYDGIDYGQVVKKALDWLMALQDADGRFGSRENPALAVNHAIATLVLAKAYIMSGTPRFKAPAQKGLDHLAALRESGRLWRPPAESGEEDDAASFWAHTALVCAERDDDSTDRLIVALQARAGARAWLDGMMESASRGFGRRAALALAARAWVDGPQDDPRLKRGMEALMRDLPSAGLAHIDYDRWLFASIAVMWLDARDGPRWLIWKRHLMNALLCAEGQREQGCPNGSWDPVDKGGLKGGRVYATAINALCQELVYDYSNVVWYRAARSETNK